MGKGEKIMVKSKIDRHRSAKGKKVKATDGEQDKKQGEGGMGVPARKSSCPRPPSLSAEVQSPVLVG